LVLGIRIKIFLEQPKALRLADLRGNIRMLVSLMSRDTRMLAGLSAQQAVITSDRTRDDYE
jgi:hypothetical protein